MDKFRSWLGSNRHQCRVNPASWLKTSEFGLLADTCHLLSKHGMVLELDHAEKIAGRAQKNRLGQGNGHSSPDSASMRLFAVAVCNTHKSPSRSGVGASKFAYRLDAEQAKQIIRPAGGLFAFSRQIQFAAGIEAKQIGSPVCVSRLNSPPHGTNELRWRLREMPRPDSGVTHGKSAGGTAPPASLRTLHEPLNSHRSHQANAPIIPFCQCTKRYGCVSANCSKNLLARILWPFSRLYFFIAHATSVLLKCLKTGYIAERENFP